MKIPSDGVEKAVEATLKALKEKAAAEKASSGQPPKTSIHEP
jgi:hypothetical protein